ncbi:type II toxin-antitoxin system RelE/ParE family toxin [Chryseobacterium taklimakanense]|uniref:Type II toxin-antitoxin system RelE/ParE family toxin n=1 Tax=Kaistella yananensis TaxID=2989820 RepID=A0ABT3JMK3_9FLAO|nr:MULTISPECIES: type II toxin-antitoxin system RelE/ParE family toxin [Chryseobacterium group]AZI22311.1 type II toxin-antitoxin system RelE/ParE family toxin [Chryseobacterium taklimakanense]MCW4451946.1 type II toxin-antitoxin system RelE/ParE family toxin [Kaistella yananensis]
MAKKIIWSRKAQVELIEILEYWINRNKSNTFSIKLNELVDEQLKLLTENPKIGRKTDIENVYIKVIHKYLLYYELVENELHVLTIRHGSKNPKTLKLE